MSGQRGAAISAVGYCCVALAVGCSCTQRAPPQAGAATAEAERQQSSTFSAAGGAAAAAEQGPGAAVPHSTEQGQGNTAPAASAASKGAMQGTSKGGAETSGAGSSIAPGGAETPSGARAAAPAPRGEGDTRPSASGTNGGKRGQGTPAEAASRAAALSAKAAQAAQGGDFSRAYQQALAAWQTVTAHDDDPQCRRQAQQLLDELRKYGEAQNATQAPPDRFQTLIAD